MSGRKEGWFGEGLDTGCNVRGPWEGSFMDLQQLTTYGPWVAAFAGVVTVVKLLISNRYRLKIDLGPKD
jgi:hypothetical protein